MENEDKKIWPLAAIWLISVAIIAIGINYGTERSVLKCRGVVSCIPSLIGALLAASSIGIIISGIACLIVGKWRNLYSFLAGALIVNVLFFVFFILK